MKLKGPSGGCRRAERGVKFSIVSTLTSGCGVDIASGGRGTLYKDKIVRNVGILLIGPRACVGLDNRSITRIVGFCGLSPSRRVVIVFSSVSLRPKHVHVHGGNDTNNRGKVGDVVTVANARNFDHVGINIKRGPRN